LVELLTGSDTRAGIFTLVAFLAPPGALARFVEFEWVAFVAFFAGATTMVANYSLEVLLL